MQINDVKIKEVTVESEQYASYANDSIITTSENKQGFRVNREDGGGDLR